MRTRLRRLVPAVALVAMTAALGTVPASAESSSGGSSASSGACTAYASGTGMGQYCLAGGGDVQTLRERFGKQKFDRCKFTEPEDFTKPGQEPLQVPFNPTPDEGRWMVRTCINFIDWDTFDGGRDRQFNIHLAYIPFDFDVTYEPTPVSEFLWNLVTTRTDFPIPVAQPQPTPVPRVGVPAYFVFRWTDPETRDVVAQGQYEGQDGGGPFIRIDQPGGLEMEARAENIEIDPLQTDMQAVDCGADNPTYDEALGPDPARQPSSCYITFPRSSASAADKMKDVGRKQAASQGNVYYVRVRTTWNVRFRENGGAWQQMPGDDLVQVTDQPLPVRESQASNLPPRFTLS